MPAATRLLTIASAPPGSSAEATLRAFRLFILIHLAARAVFQAHFDLATTQDWTNAGVLLSAAVIVGVIIGLIGNATRMEGICRAAIAGLAVLMVTKVIYYSPGTSNHQYLEAWVVVALALFSFDSERDRTLMSGTLRWMAAIVLFYTGLQKLLYGAYFDGQFFGYEISRELQRDDASTHRFASFFGLMLPAEEMQRLHDIGPPTDGSGPYAIAYTPMTILSILTMIAEMGLPVLLLIRRTRSIAAVLACGLIVMIQLGAREYLFGVLFMNMMLLFLNQPWNRRLLPVFCAFYTFLFLSRLGWLPGALTLPQFGH